MFVKPAPHPDKPDEQRRVRIPHTHALLANAGEEVPDNAFWLRRRMHGDVVDAERPKPAATVDAPQQEVAAETTAAGAPPEPHPEAAAVAPPPAHPEATQAPRPAAGTGA